MQPTYTILDINGKQQLGFHYSAERQFRKRRGNCRISERLMETIQLPNNQPLPPRVKGQA
jgi:hypothetical protein